MTDLISIILAAGKGTRLKSNLPKVLHRVAGRTMIEYSLALTQKIKSEKNILVVSPSNHKLIAAVLQEKKISCDYAIQEPQLGTGHAVMVGLKKIPSSYKGSVLVLCGDVPSIHQSTLTALMKIHQEQQAVLSLVTQVLKDPAQYGRILRNENDEVTQIVEFKDATADQKKLNEINLAIYLFEISFLRKYLKEIKATNAQKEFYLTDLLSLAASNNLKIASITVDDPTEGLGVNDMNQLSQVEKNIYLERIAKWEAEGVRFVLKEQVCLDEEVRLEAGTVIHGPAYLRGKVKIGKNCVIETGCVIENTDLAAGVHLKPYCVITESKIGESCVIGPFAHLRPLSQLKKKVKVGNFVELKKSVLGDDSKVSHLSYIGDATLGKRVNVGAGTITCNYDGVNKYATVLEDDVFVGSDSQFVAPVRVKKGAYIGAGSTITKNVSPNTLAVARSRQVEIKKWKKPTKKVKK